MQKAVPAQDAALSAGGTLSLPELSLPARAWRLVEMALIFGGAPYAVDRAVHHDGIPVFIALLPVLAVVLMFLVVDRTFSLGRELSRGFSLWQLLSIIVVFAVGGGLVSYYVAQHYPQWFLEFPRNRPETYQRIMILYPLMSVIVQELVYRTFFFHRYGVLFGRQWWLAILVNGFAFGFGHIVIRDPVAIYGSMGLGLLLAWRYAMTRSFWAVFIEHTLWGWLVFTIGLGRFFFTGVGVLNWR